KTGSYRVEAASDTNHAAAIPECIDGLLNIGKLTMTIYTIADRHRAEIAFAGGRPMVAAIVKRRGADGRAPVNESQSAKMVQDAARRSLAEWFDQTIGSARSKNPIVTHLEVATYGNE